jgi:hypothetical protein
MSRTWWRSGWSHDSWWLISTKLTLGADRLRDLKWGNPTLRPARAPFLEAAKLPKAAAASAVPDWKACMETSRHQGATSSLVWLKALPRLKADHDSEGVRSDSATPAARSALRRVRFSRTAPIAQL